MKKKDFFKLFTLIVFILTTISCAIYAKQSSQNVSYKSPILNNYKKQKINVNLHI